MTMLTSGDTKSSATLIQLQRLRTYTNMDHVIVSLTDTHICTNRHTDRQTNLMGGTSWNKDGISNTLSYRITLYSIFL